MSGRSLFLHFGRFGKVFGKPHPVVVCCSQRADAEIAAFVRTTETLPFFPKVFSCSVSS